MAVRVALSGRGIPARMAAASFPITSTPTRATGGWAHRVTAWYGTVGVPMPGPSIVMAVPPGPTAGHSAAVGPDMFPTLSVVRKALPRLLPTAGGIPHGVPGLGYTVAGAQPAQDQVVRPAYRVRTGAGQARVTTSPMPTFRWKTQPSTRRGRG